MPGHAAPGHMHAGRQMRLQAGPPPRRCASTPAWIQRCVGPPPHVFHAGPLARLYAKLGRVASTRARRCHVLGNRVDGRQATAPGTTKKEASWRFSRLQKQCLDLLAAIPLAHTKGLCFLHGGRVAGSLGCLLRSAHTHSSLCFYLRSPLDSSLMVNVPQGAIPRSPRRAYALGGGVPPRLGGRRTPRRRQLVGTGGGGGRGRGRGRSGDLGMRQSRERWRRRRRRQGTRAGGGGSRGRAAAEEEVGACARQRRW